MNLWTGAMVYRQFRYEIMSVHLCCTFGARVLHFYWHYYSKVFTVAFLSHCYDILSVYLCCTIGIAMLYLWYQDALLLWYRFFNDVYRQYQGEFSDEMQQDSSMRV